MLRQVLILIGLSALLFAADGALRSARERDRSVHATVLSSIGSPLRPDKVTEIRFQSSGRGSRFTLTDSLWRCPDYHGVLLDGSTVTRLLDASLASTVNVAGLVTDTGDTFPHSLQFSSGDRSLELRLGPAAPGQFPERFVRRSDSDTLYQLHDDPLPILLTGAGDIPPLLDRRIIPVALRRQSLDRIHVTGREPFSVVRRSNRTSASRDLVDAIPFSWTVESRGRASDGSPAATSAFVSRIARLSWQGVVPVPSETTPAGRLVLSDASGTSDTLDIWRDPAGAIVSNRTLGLAFAVDTPADSLLSLPRP